LLSNRLRLKVGAIAILLAVSVLIPYAPRLEAGLVHEDARMLRNNGLRSANSVPAILTPMETYRIRPGDTLWGIARRHNLDVRSVAALNNLTLTSVLRVGEQLHLPTAPRRVHRVLPGQTLWRIARTYGVTVEEVMLLNNIDSVLHLRVGQTLLLPASTLRVANADSEALTSRTKTRLFWPIVGVISSPYGLRHGEVHHGIDIAAPRGAAIKAARSGAVVYTGWRRVYGRTVIINHGDGTRTLYGHASKILVHTGQQVRAGQIIARVGSSGRSTGPHLHFELYQGEQTINPLRYLGR